MKNLLKLRTASIDDMLDVAQEVALQQKIRSRAYELYQERGRGEGHELDDWLQAEDELSVKSKAA